MCRSKTCEIVQVWAIIQEVKELESIRNIGSGCKIPTIRCGSDTIINPTDVLSARRLGCVGWQRTKYTLFPGSIAWSVNKLIGSVMCILRYLLIMDCSVIS